MSKLLQERSLLSVPIDPGRTGIVLAWHRGAVIRSLQLNTFDQDEELCATHTYNSP